MSNHMLKYFHLTFSRCYHWSLKVNKHSKSHVFYASAMLCMGIIINLTTITLLLLVLGVRLPTNFFGFEYFKYIVAGIGMIALELVHRYFLRNDNYKKIIKMFPHKGTHRFVLFYSAGSFFLLCTTVYGIYLVNK